MTPKDVLKLAKEKGVKIVDLRFIDLPGLWQHFSIPVSELSEGIFEDGLGFDGSSIRGFQTIDESDMLLIPDPATAVMGLRVTEDDEMAGLDLSQHSETAYSLGGSSYGEYGMSGSGGAFAEAMKAAQAKHTAH